MKIAHLSDIHIRSNTRHDEYELIFAELYEKLGLIKPDHILLAGDIGHTKTQEAPEFYNFTANFFTELAKIAQLHIIAGNHDCNVLNPKRMDIISPIINMLDNKNIHFYRDSKRIDFDKDFSFFVYSILDKQNWNNWIIDNNRINVALYHGTVGGSRTDLNFALDAEVELSEFKDYDYTLLGDIHKHQFLDEKKHIAYVGTLIQQNYSEEPSKGFLIWDIKDKNNYNTIFETLTPVNPFFTIEINKKNIKIEDYDFIPQKSRIRLKFLKQVDSRTIDKLANDFSTTFNAKEVVTITDIYDNKDFISFEKNKIKLSDLSNKFVQEKLIKEYLSKYENINDELLMTQICDINSKFDTITAAQLSQARNINWKIKKIYFSNLFSYKEDNIIHFNKMKGIVGAFGKNTIGKSSIIDAILYGLFNGNSKNIVKNQNIINTRKNNCCVKLELELNNIQYIIDRTTTRLTVGKRKKTQKDLQEYSRTDLDFYKIDNEKISLNGLQRADTDKNIRAIFGTQDDFLATCVAAQFDVNNFINHGSSRRKEIVSKFLGLDIFEEKYKLAKDEAYELKTTLKISQNKDYKKLLVECRADEKTCKQDLINYQNELKIKKIESDNLINIILQLEEKIESFKQINTINNLQEQLIFFENELNKTNNEIIIKTNDLNNLNEKYSNINLEKIKLDLIVAENRLAELQEKFQIKNKLFNEEINTDFEYTELLESVKALEGIPCENKYPTCKFIKNANDAKNRLPELEKSLKDIRNNLEIVTEYTKEIMKHDFGEQKVNCLSELSAYDKYKAQIINIELQIKNKELELEKFQTKILSIKKELAEYEIDSNNDLTKQLDDLKQKLIDTKNNKKFLINDIQSLEAKIFQTTKKLGGTQEKIKELITDSQNLEELNKKYIAYEYYLKSISKNGLQREIIYDKLSFINSEIDKLLRNVVDFKAYFTNENDKLEIYIDYKDAGGPRLIETASGFEKTITSLAIRVALIKISTLPKPDIFIIDECFRAFDEGNLESVSKFLQILKQSFSTVLVITHIDTIKDNVDFILNIERTQDKYSYIQ